jgi:hypothetical protein
MAWKAGGAGRWRRRERACVSSVWRACVCVSWNHTFRRVLHRLCRIRGTRQRHFKKTFYSPFAECQIGGHSAKLGFAECQALGKQIFANSILTCKTQKKKIQIKNKHYFMHNNFKLKLR